MSRQKRRILSFLLAVCTIFSCLLPSILPLSVKSSEFPNTYVNTGDQRKDILGVALTQIGFTEGPYNRTPYGAWYGLANQPWCASFISWCATQADVGHHILKPSAVAEPGYEYFNIPYYDGTEYTPQPGDLFFTKTYDHVGFVYYVEGDYFYTVEANTNVHDPDNPKPSDAEGLYVMTNRRRTKDYYFGVPAYEGGDGGHTYVKAYEDAHPHKSYYACTACGDTYYTGYTGYVESCPDCLTCTCSSNYKGYYTTTAFLNISYDHSADSAVIGHIISDEVIYVYGADPDTGRAYINYDGKRGHIKLGYLQSLQSPIPLELSIEQYPAHTQYFVGETLNTEGLVLRLHYSDTSSQIITEGYTTEGFSSDQPGVATVTVNYEGLTVTYDVQISAHTPGDIDLNGQKNRDDVMLLLWHISFPDRFPITVPADFTNDDTVDRDDVMALLWHISFPDKFPLATTQLLESFPIIEAH